MSDAAADHRRAVNGINALERANHRCSLALTAAVAAVVGVLLIVLGAADDAAGGQPAVGDGRGGVALVPVGEFAAPVNVAFAPGEPGNVYVVEQDGIVRVLAGAVEQAEPFLDLSDRTNGAGERGLLGVAFHPDYQANRLLYAYYTHAGTGDIVVSEFAAPDPLDADEASRRQVIRIRHRFASNHNGGQLLFGPDGHLYMGTGDGGGGGDPRENAQNKRSLLGKLLRIDPLDPPGERAYRSPGGNPYKGRMGRNEILARGLRNPFRFSFDGRRILIGDVGQDRFEEVNFETPRGLRGANFGWDRFEGPRRHRGPGDDEARTPKRKRHDRPIHAYRHRRDGFSCSITGGVVVRDPALANLHGRYLFADFCAGVLRSFVPALRGAEQVRKLGTDLPSPTSFAADPVSRQVYATSLDGPVYRISPLP